jgi:hypothetical protein
MPRGEPPFFTSNPGEKHCRQLRTRSTVPGTVSASPIVAAPSAQDVDAPKFPTQSKSSSKKKIESKKNSAASATTVVPKSPTQSKSSKKKENESYKKSLYDIAKALKAASPRPPAVVAPKEAAPSLAPTVSTASGNLLERKASSASGTSSSGSSSDDDASSGSSSDDDSSSASSQPAIVTGGSNVGSGTAIVSAAELIAAVSAATNPSTKAVTEEVLDAVSAPAHDVPMEPSSRVFVKVNFFILSLTLDLKCVL